MKQIIIDQTGRTIVRSYTDTEVELTQAIAQSLNSGTTIVVPNIHMLNSHGEDMRCGARISTDGGQVWCIMLHSIRFTTGIRSREGVISLNFEAADKMELLWRPVKEMKLVLMVSAYKEGGNLWACDKCYLAVFDDTGRAWRMPVANVFDDASLCTGDFARIMPTMTGLVQICYTQFRESPWNADLYSSKNEAFKIQTERMFRWKANDSGFQQLAPDREWRELCIPVGNDMLTIGAEILEQMPVYEANQVWLDNTPEPNEEADEDVVMEEANDE